jgi:hypothetical protein
MGDNRLVVKSESYLLAPVDDFALLRRQATVSVSWMIGHYLTLFCRPAVGPNDFVGPGMPLGQKP